MLAQSENRLSLFAFANPGVTSEVFTLSARCDTEIKIGQTMPYSGPASAYTTIGKVQAAYFRMINESGGIRGRKITLLSYDDGYNPTKTVEQVRKLVESDEVLPTFQILGTAPNAAVQKYLNAKKVPRFFCCDRRETFYRSRAFPMDHGLQSQLPD
jgi:ABC-type branched-subunit amino acid transport system substrate-binding protein